LNLNKKNNPTLIILGYEQCQVLFNLLLVRIILGTKQTLLKTKEIVVQVGPNLFFIKIASILWFHPYLILAIHFTNVNE